MTYYQRIDFINKIKFLVRSPKHKFWIFLIIIKENLKIFIL